MNDFELTVPKMGESVAEATITRWVKNVGDTIAVDDVVLEIATDKVDTDIQATEAGVLKQRFFNEGDVVKVGQVIALISKGAAGQTPTQPIAVAATTAPVIEQTQATPSHKGRADAKSFYSPLVRSIAQHEGLAPAELQTINGSGTGGRVTKTDVKAYIANRKQNRPVATTPPTEAVAAAGPFAFPDNTVLVQRPAVSMMAGDEIKDMDRMRKLIADHMVMSKHVAPHVTAFVEADVTNLVYWRNRVKDAFERREGQKITYMPAIVDAVVKAIKDFPLMNVSVDQTGTKIISRKAINIGMATALPSGNLIVPVIKNAQEKNLTGLTTNLNELADKARNNKLLPEDVQGGTFTISNVGSFGNLMGTPIINQPQVAILAVGIIKKKPAVIETPTGDVIAVRHFMYLSLSFDHRVVDGSLGGVFVKRIADYLENWDSNTPL